MFVGIKMTYCWRYSEKAKLWKLDVFVHCFWGHSFAKGSNKFIMISYESLLQKKLQWQKNTVFCVSIVMWCFEIGLSFKMTIALNTHPWMLQITKIEISQLHGSRFHCVPSFSAVYLGQGQHKQKQFVDSVCEVLKFFWAQSMLQFMVNTGGTLSKQIMGCSITNRVKDYSGWNPTAFFVCSIRKWGVIWQRLSLIAFSFFLCNSKK